MYATYIIEYQCGGMGTPILKELTMIDKPVRNTIPDVQLSKEQRWEIIDKMTDESSNAWFNAFVQEGNAREKNRLRQEAVAKGLPVPVFAGE